MTKRILIIEDDKATARLLRDNFEIGLKNQGLPDFIEAGGRELPIVVQDKVFIDPATISTVDPTWPFTPVSGNLWYAHVYDTALYGPLGPAPLGPPPAVSVVPEFFGDTRPAAARFICLRCVFSSLVRTRRS